MSFKKLTIIILVLFLVFKAAGVSFAQSVDQIKQNIESHNQKIKQLEEAIKTYEQQINTVSGQAQTLQSAIKVLDINQKKVGTEINKTETNIQKTNLTIQDLGNQIGDIEAKISSNTEAIAKILNNINQNDQQSLIESFLTNKSLADIFDEYQSMSQFQQKVRDQSKELKAYEDQLSEKRAATEEQKKNLVSLKSDLSDQNKILVINKKEKSNLLTDTQNKEANYKKILAETQAEKNQFEKELSQFESQLKIAIDPNSFPAPGKAVFSWPLDNIFITQFFGQTTDAAKLYVSEFHGGVDLRASIGTPVKAALSGVVTDTESRVARNGCQYGYWVLIKHPNGLSTLYGHLSLVRVSPGQSVGTGELLGYSGQTGYSRGPHLHLGVYVTQGIRIVSNSATLSQNPSKSICRGIKTVAADPKAYLDPMLYFPSL
jgi:murein DD-endopeptidase MepM/ murein hydrolase activator NlpD